VPEQGVEGFRDPRPEDGLPGLGVEAHGAVLERDLDPRGVLPVGLGL
jgi:hypothetical protein